MKPLLLCIMDGVGIRKETYGNAFQEAHKPHFDDLWDRYPHTLLDASEQAVGLPKGQMGNSEVGHMNIGSGRVVFQSLELINQSLEDDSLFQKQEFHYLIDYAKKNHSKIHIMGLFSDGGVHSHMNHFLKILDYMKNNHFETYAHIITDGRDTKPECAYSFLEDFIQNYPNTIASISGRYYAMDRDKRWDRTNEYYEAITGKGIYQENVLSYLKECYEENITDEFIKPAVLSKKGSVSSNDVVIWINFRPDRAKQILWKLQEHSIYTLTMMPVSEEIKFPYLLKISDLQNTLGEYLSNLGISQLRIAETEKYAHVTYFFDGGKETSYSKCDKILIPSPKVATYDLKPEMSAYEVCERLLTEIDKDKYQVIILNFANCDMVGHSGLMEPTIKAVETVDNCLGKLYQKMKEKDGIFIITADHGNCDYMIDQEGNKVTSHSLSPVPFILCKENLVLENGKLSDIAPTILSLLDLKIPVEMTGKVLYKKEL